MNNHPATSPSGPTVLKRIAISSYLRRLLWLGMLPLVLFASWLTYDRVRDHAEERDQQARALAEKIASSVDQQLKSRINGLKMLAYSPLAGDQRLLPEMYREALGYLDTFGSHVILATADEPRRMLLNTRVPYGTALPLLPVPRGHAAAPAAIRTGRPAVSDSFTGPVAKEILVAIAVPVMREGKAAAVLLTTCEARLFQDLVNQTSLPDGWSLYLKDGRGEDIAHRIPLDAEPEQLSSQSGTFTVRSSESPWSVSLVIPVTAQNDPLFSAAVVLVAGLLAAILLGLLGGVLAGRRLETAIKGLATRGGERVPSNIDEIAAVGTLLDQAENDLLRSEERYRKLFDEAPLPLCYVGGDGTVEALNISFQSLIGYTRDDIPTVDAWWHRAYPDLDYRSEMQRNWNAARECDPTADGTGTVRECRITCKDGTERTMLLSSIVSAGGIMVAFADISEQRRAERELRNALAAQLAEQRQARLATLNQMEDANAARAGAEEALTALQLSEKRFQDVVQASEDWVWEVDKDVRYIYASRSVIHILGYRPEELIGRTPFELMPPDEAERVQEEFRTIAAKRAPFRDLENLNLHRDGTIRHLLTSGLPLFDGAGEFAGYRGMDRDVTAQKRVEEELVRKNTYLEQFLYTTSHDLRTPLVTVKTFLGFLEKDMAAGNMERFAEDLKYIHMASDKMKQLLDRLLEMTRADNIVLPASEMSLREIIEESARNLAGLAETKGAEIHLPETDVTLYGSRERLCLVWQNLIENAITHSREDLPPVVTLDVAHQGGETVFSVRDNGIGIDPQYHDRVFMMFERLNPNSSGAGLGLSMIKHVVESEGGNIWIESAGAETGTRISFTLPKAVVA